MKRSAVRTLIVATAVLATISIALPSSALSATGKVMIGHPATYPWGATEYAFSVAEACGNSPLQGVDGYVFDLGTNPSQRHGYSLSTSALAQVNLAHLVFYEGVPGDCEYSKGYWFRYVPVGQTQFPSSSVRWLVVSFPAGADIEVTLNWW